MDNSDIKDVSHTAIMAEVKNIGKRLDAYTEMNRRSEEAIWLAIEETRNTLRGGPGVLGLYTDMELLKKSEEIRARNEIARTKREWLIIICLLPLIFDSIKDLLFIA